MRGCPVHLFKSRFFDQCIIVWICHCLWGECVTQLGRRACRQRLSLKRWSVQVKFGSQSQSLCIHSTSWWSLQIFFDSIHKWRLTLFKKYGHDVRRLTHPTTPDSVAQGNPFRDVEWTTGSSLANYKSARAMLLEYYYDSTDVRVLALQCHF